MEYFAEIRNTWLQMRDKKDDYLFSVDSDILIPPESLKQLLSHKLPIVSMLLANGPIGDPYISPNRLDNFLLPYTVAYQGVHPDFIMRSYMSGRMAFNIMDEYSYNGTGRNQYDTVNYRHLDPAELYVREIMNYNPNIYFSNLKCRPELGPWTVPQRYGELVEIGMTGAGYLIDRKVVDSGVEYGYHHQGEDCYFCNLAKDKGFTIHCDYTIKADHIMNEEIYKEYLAKNQMRVLGMKPDKKEVRRVKVEMKRDGIKSSVPVKLEKVGGI
jgi:glycosyltransferase involved in cell wall biosynthesis